MKMVCMCGCGGKAYHSQMVTVEVEQAIDHDIRKTGTTKRFWVLPKCRKPFEEELALTIILQKLVKAWAPKPLKWWQVTHWPLCLANWIRRIAMARRVMRLQYGIWARTKGFEYARMHATNSALLFGAPRFMQGWLARRFGRKMRKEICKALSVSSGPSSK